MLVRDAIFNSFSGSNDRSVAAIGSGATVRPGNILFEVDGLPESVARESLRLAADKLPVRTKFLSRHRVRAA